MVVEQRKCNQSFTWSSKSATFYFSFLLYEVYIFLFSAKQRDSQMKVLIILQEKNIIKYLVFFLFFKLTQDTLENSLFPETMGVFSLSDETGTYRN